MLIAEMAQRDNDRDTPITNLSGGYPILQNMANELAQKLHGLGTLEALTVRNQLLALTSIMASWGPDNPPTPEERRRLLDELSKRIKQAIVLLPHSSTR